LIFDTQTTVTPVMPELDVRGGKLYCEEQGVGALRAAPAVALGWNAGGIVALHLAVAHPQLVRAWCSSRSPAMRSAASTSR
jgi:hypothetical protein